MAQSKLSVEETEHQHHDKITLCWTILSFKALYDATKASKKMRFVQEEFTVGENNWEFCLEHENKEDVGITLDYLGPDWVSAEYSVYLKSSEGEFIETYNTGLRKYAPEDSNIQGAAQGWGCSDLHYFSALQQRFLKDDILTFKLKLSVYETNPSMKIKLSKDLKKGLDSTVGSDVKFVFVEEEGSENVIGEIKAHKAILSLRSNVFATMFSSGMTETKNGEVKISDMTPKAMKILLSYVYSGEVDSEWGSAVEELLNGAEKYELDQLKGYLCENIHSALTPRNVWRIRKLASLIKLPNVLKATIKFMKENIQDVAENVEEVTLKKDKKSL